MINFVSSWRRRCAKTDVRMRANGPHKIWAFHLAPTLSNTSCLAKCIASKVTKDQLNRHHDCKCPPLFTCLTVSPVVLKNKTFLKTFPHRDREPPCVHMLLKNLNTAGGISVLVIWNESTFATVYGTTGVIDALFGCLGTLLLHTMSGKRKAIHTKSFFTF